MVNYSILFLHYIVKYLRRVLGFKHNALYNPELMQRIRQEKILQNLYAWRLLIGQLWKLGHHNLIIPASDTCFSQNVNKAQQPHIENASNCWLFCCVVVYNNTGNMWKRRREKGSWRQGGDTSRNLYPLHCVVWTWHF